MEYFVSTILTFMTINFWFCFSRNLFVKFYLHVLVLARGSMNLAGLSQANRSSEQNLTVQLIVVEIVIKYIDGKPAYRDAWGLSVATDSRCSVRLVLTLQNWRQVYKFISRGNTRTYLTLYSSMRWQGADVISSGWGHWRRQLDCLS